MKRIYLNNLNEENRSINIYIKLIYSWDIFERLILKAKINAKVIIIEAYLLIYKQFKFVQNFLIIFQDH